MTEELKDAERVAFEAWAKDWWFWGDIQEPNAENAAWEAWQARAVLTLTDEQRVAIEAAISISADIEADSHDGSFLSAESVQALRALLHAGAKS